MNVEKNLKFDTKRLVNNISSTHLINKESYDTDRNKIKGYKDIL